MPNPAAVPGCPARRSRAGGTAGLSDLLDGTILFSMSSYVYQAVPWGIFVTAVRVVELGGSSFAQKRKNRAEFA